LPLHGGINIELHRLIARVDLNQMCKKPTGAAARQDADGAIVERQSSVRAILMRINAQQRVLSSNCF
jgi:hypothetical protein